MNGRAGFAVKSAAVNWGMRMLGVLKRYGRTGLLEEGFHGTLHQSWVDYVLGPCVSLHTTP
ncbi:MAG: hypothetical protein QXU53_07060 [Thermosphaera sp.]